MSAQPVTPAAVLVTTVAFALFLSVTAHVAARNVLGTSVRCPRSRASSPVGSRSRRR
jgi:hypothetical protein